MEVIILIIFFAIGAFIVFAYQSANMSALNKAYKRLAANFDGDFITRASWEHPEPWVQFVRDGAQVRVGVHSTGSKSRGKYTELQVGWPDDSNFRCELFPRNFFNRLGRLIGFREIKVGSVFDGQFVIRGTSDEQVRNLISPQVQASIDRLRDVTYFRDVYVMWGGGRMVVRVRGIIRDYAVLKRFTNRGLELFEYAISTRAEGIEFVDDELTSSKQEAICQVCGDRITDDAVYCRSCKTPHHRECWKYYGTCAIYGCGQKKFVKRLDLQRR